jgi:glutamate-1-semialdehyde 2,1-aminomutase
VGFDDYFREADPRSAEIFAAAVEVLPAGVGSSARSVRAGWAPYPPSIARGDGSHVTDADGHTYTDYLLGLGPMLLGHRHPVVTRAVADAIGEIGTVFGLPFELEGVAARKVVDAVPSVEMVRFASSGSEAVGTAVRLARTITERPLVVRFEGHYHGWMDTVYWSNHPKLDVAGPDERPVPVAAGRGLPPALADTLVILPWNDPAAFEAAMGEHGDRVAAVITEPIMLNTGCIMPEPGYLQLLRDVTSSSGSLLVFDEVITGFRVARGGGQELFGITPDLTTMAKGLGGGFPVAAIGGRRDHMEYIADGRYSHSGTYNSNVIAAAAVSATMDVLATPGTYERLHAVGDRLRSGLTELVAKHGLRATVAGVGPVFQIWFTDAPIRSYRDAARNARPEVFTRWWQEMFTRGVLFHPSQDENLFISTAHTDEDVDNTLAAADEAMAVVAGEANG